MANKDSDSEYEDAPMDAAKIEEEEDTPKSSPASASKLRTPRTKRKASASSTPDSRPVTPTGTPFTGIRGEHVHDTWDWLSVKRTDKRGRVPTDPGYTCCLAGSSMVLLLCSYDPSTLYVPAEFLKKQTPGMRQWWEFKVGRKMSSILYFRR